MLTKQDLDFENKEEYELQIISKEEDEYLDEVDYQLTVRSVVIGTFIGCVMSASNLYLGYKTGLAFYACFFGSILGFGIGKVMEPLPNYLGGGKLGIRENCSIQTAATATGLLSTAFNGPIPVLFRNKIIDNIDDAWGPVLCWMLGASFFGMFFAVPMRSYFVIQQQLAFPGPSAAAHMINKLHTGKDGIPRKQTMALVYTLGAAIAFKVFVYFVPFLFDIHIIYWIGYAASYKPFIDIDTLFKWHIQLSPAYVGIGMTSGLNVAASIFLGTIVSWGVIAPSLFYYGSEVYKKSVLGSVKNEVTVQNWNLWVGVVIMLTASITELLINYKSVFSSLRDPIIHVYNNYLLRVIPSLTPITRQVYDKDPVRPEDQIPTWQWVSGLIISVIFTILTYHFYFGIHVGLTILACVFSFILSYVACQIYGETFINPGSTLAKATQAIFAGVPAANPTIFFTSNLMAGALTSISSVQSTEMVGDLKTGHILKASPKSQFYAQILSTIPGIFVSVALFFIFAKAYPCIIDNTIAPLSDNCPFSLPNVLAWEFITNALTLGGASMIPYSCQIALIISFVVTFVVTFLRSTVFKKHSQYIPNMAIFGMAFVLPGSAVSFGFFIGGLIALIWEKLHPESHKLYFVSVSSAFVAGEGIGGLVTAVFTIAGMDQTKLATSFGCIKSAASC